MSEQITPEILLSAYAAGIFPMAESAHDSALYWMEPEWRGVLPLNQFHIPKSLRKRVRQQKFDIRIDTAFEAVIDACAAPGKRRRSTWINDRIRRLFIELHGMGFGHSVEAWQEDKLAGGLYGLKLGGAFFGESMFSRADDASKVCLVHLVARLKHGGFGLLDAQFVNDHLRQFGIIEIAKQDYLNYWLYPAIDINADFASFSQDGDAEKVLQLAQSDAI